VVNIPTVSPEAGRSGRRISAGRTDTPAWSIAIRRLRKSEALSQEGFAERLDVGTTTVQGWERGDHPPGPYALRRIRETFGVSPIDLGVAEVRPSWSDAILRLREREALSQEQFAERVGVEPRTVQRWERGVHRPRRSQVRRICRSFGSSPTDFGLVAPKLQGPEAKIESGGGVEDRLERIASALELLTPVLAELVSSLSVRSSVRPNASPYEPATRGGARARAREAAIGRGTEGSDGHRTGDRTAQLTVLHGTEPA